MGKQKFFLFRRNRKDGNKGYEYIQYLVSPSHDDGLSCSCWPEYAWRGQTTLDIRKMEYLISISPNYNKDRWELVEYEMEAEQQSWASLPEVKQYEDLLKGKKLRRLSDKEMIEFDNFKQKIEAKWKKEEIIPTKETPTQY